MTRMRLGYAARSGRVNGKSLNSAEVAPRSKRVRIHTQRATTGASANARKQAPLPPLLLGHSKLESTVRYLGIEVDDALELAEQTDV